MKKNIITTVILFILATAISVIAWPKAQATPATATIVDEALASEAIEFTQKMITLAKKRKAEEYLANTVSMSSKQHAGMFKTIRHYEVANTNSWSVEQIENNTYIVTISLEHGTALKAYLYNNNTQWKLNGFFEE